MALEIVDGIDSIGLPSGRPSRGAHMCMFVVAVLVAAVVLGTVFDLGWLAAIALGVVVILAMSFWETISRPRKVRQAFQGERARLLHAGWAEEDANMAARAYVRQKFDLQ